VIKKLLIGAVVFFVLVVIVITISGPSGEKATIKQVGAKQDLTTTVENIITDKLGETLVNDSNKKRIVSVVILTNDPADWPAAAKNKYNATIELNADENTSGDLTKYGILGNIKDILQPISELNSDLYQIGFAFHLPLVDKFGKKKDELVLNYVIDEPTWDKIQWDNFNPDDFPSLVVGTDHGSYYEHDVLKQ